MYTKIDALVKSLEMAKEKGIIMADSEIELKNDKGMRLNMELGSLLGFQFEGISQFFKAILVGLEPQQYLILKIEIPKEFRHHIVKDAKLNITFMSSGSEYGFSTMIVDHITAPYKLIFISYPSKVENLDARARTRVCCYLPATATMNEKNIKGTLNDISINGCKFVIKLPVNLQPRQLMLIDDIQLFFPLMELEDPLEFYGRVRNTTIDKKKIAMGIEFTNLTSELQKSIDDYIQSVVDISSVSTIELSP